MKGNIEKMYIDREKGDVMIRIHKDGHRMMIWNEDGNSNPSCEISQDCVNYITMRRLSIKKILGDHLLDYIL